MRLIALMLSGVALVMLLAGTTVADDGRFTFSGLTVKDKLTGLIWTRDANLGKLDWGRALELVSTLNGKTYAGVRNWRLPSREEVRALMQYAMSAGCGGGQDRLSPYNFFNAIGFSNVQLCEYVTSNPQEAETPYTCVISTYDGMERNEDKEHEFCVWPVHAGE